MASAEELRNIIRKPVTEAFGGIGGKDAAMAALGIFSADEFKAEKAVGAEMKKLAKQYERIVQTITGIKKGWSHYASITMLSLDNEDAGIVIDITWKGNAITKKVDVVVDMARREGPERPGAKWRNKVHIVRDIVPTTANLSPRKIIADPAVRSFLKESAEELLTPLTEDDGWVLMEVNKYDIRRSEEAWKDAEAIADSYEEDGDKRAKKARADAAKLKKDHDALVAKWEKQKKKSREYSRARAGAMRSVGMVRTRSGQWEGDMSTADELRAIIEGKPRGPVKGGGQGYGSYVASPGASHEPSPQMIDQLGAGAWEDIADAIAIIDEGEVVLIDETFEGLAERKADFIDMGPIAMDRDPRRMLMLTREAGKSAGKQMANNFDPVYVLDDVGHLANKSMRHEFAKGAESVLGKRVDLEKIRSPRTGKPGWRMTFASGGPDVAMKADARTAQVAFNKLKSALRRTKLPTEKGDMRQADVGEFMLMNMAQGGSKAMFKHGDTRNYVVLDMKSGKLDVPRTSKPFFRGYFDVFESIDESGRGMGPGGMGKGPGGDCVCPSCGATKPHTAGEACMDMTCPKCGAKMTREDVNDVTQLRSLIEYKGTPYGKSKGSREADLWGSKHGEKKHVGSKRRSGHSKQAKKMAHKGERQAARKEIQARMRDEEEDLYDLGAYLELIEAMASDEEPVKPVEPVQLRNLQTIQQTAHQLGRFTTEFAAYLKKAMRSKEVDVARLGRFGRQVDAAHRIFKDTYRKLALGMGEAFELEDELDELAEAMAIGTTGAFDVPSPVGFAKKASLGKRRAWRKIWREKGVPMGAQEMMIELATIAPSLPMQDRKLVDKMMNMTWYGPEDLGGRPEGKGLIDAIKKLHKRIFGRVRGNPTREDVERLDEGSWDGSFVTPTARFTWTMHEYKLEELPQKGKKRLRVSSMQNPWGIIGHGRGAPNDFIADNIIMRAKLSKGDTFDRIKAKLDREFKNAIEVAKRDHPDWWEKNSWLDNLRWTDETVHYLKVVPEGTDPIVAKGRDFTVNSEWTKFSAYDPGSDMQSHDPSYTQYAAKSPAAARKLYKILKADPKALARLSWRDFRGWLNKNKIAFDTNFSSWR